MIIVILAIALLAFGIHTGWKILFPRTKPLDFSHPEYSDEIKDVLAKWDIIEAEEKRQKNKRNYSPAKEILRYEILRREGIISDRDFDTAKDDIIYG